MRIATKNRRSKKPESAHTTKAKYTVIFSFLFLPLFAGVFAQSGGTANVNPPTGGFNINGSLKVNSAVGDWVQGTTGTGGFVFDHYTNGAGVPVSGLTAGWIPDLYNSTSDLIFSGSAFADNPNTWKWVASKPTSKDDINNVMYLSTTSSTQKWLILGGDRLTTTGTSYIDFEFFQGIFTRETGGKFKSVGPNNEDLSGTGGRSLGDFVLSMEYSNGGSNAKVHYYIWEAVQANGKTSYKYVDHTDLINSTNALGATNGDTTDAAFNGSAFGNNRYIPYAFVEAAVNVDALLGSSCHQESIKTLFIKTKASDAYTASLKDFVDPQAVNFTFGSAGLDYGATSFCKTGSVTPTQPNPAQGSFTYVDVYPTPSAGTLSIDGTTGVINLAASDTGTYKITYSPSGGVCLNPSDVTIKIKPLPAGSASNQSICSGTASSVSLGSTVTGTSYTWTAAIQTVPSGGTITGYSNCSSSCGTSIAQTLNNTGTTDGLVRYTVTPVAAGCTGSNFNVDVTVKPTPSGSSSNNSPICSGATTAVNLSSTVSSTTFTWTASVQTAPTGGTITGFSNCSSSCGTSIAQALTNTGTTAGVVRYVVTPTANSCSGSTFNVDVTVNPSSAGGTVAAAQTICSGTQPNNLTLTGNVGSVVKWQRSTDNFISNSSDIASTSTTLTGATISNLTSDTWFRAVVQSANCATANSNAVKITVDATSVGGAAGSPQTICSGTQPSSDLTVTGITGSVVKWQKSTDNFVSNVTDISSSASTTLSKSTIGTLTQDTWFRAVVQNGTVCTAANSSPVKITVGAVPSKPDFTITQPSLCGPSTGTLTICQSISGYNYTVAGVTKGGTGSALSFTDLNAGSNPTLTIVNTTGSCSSGPYTCSDAVSACISSGSTRKITSETILVNEIQPTVKAYPNPFNDRVKFVVNSPATGDGSLEVYNIMGQKVKTVYQGHINSGDNSFELNLPKKQQATLIYIFRVGDKKVTGKLLQLNN